MIDFTSMTIDMKPQNSQNASGRSISSSAFVKTFVPPEPLRPVTHYISLQFTTPACARDKWIIGASNALALESVCGFFPPPMFR
jgi:hypothetical protein